MSQSFSRILLPPKGHLADANAKILHPADQGSWIWHPEKPVRETAILRFSLRLNLKEAVSALLHVTADQRFQLRCDGRDVTFGPDRCDLDHWTVQTVRLELGAGEHDLQALVWRIGGSAWEGACAAPGIVEPYPKVNPPMAQVSWCGGFLAYAEEVDPVLLNTGMAPWVVEDLTLAAGMVMPDIRQYIDIGPLFTFDLNKWRKQPSKPAIVVIGPVQTDPSTGVRRPGRCLYPAEIPEQRRTPWSGGQIRAVRRDWDEDPFQPEHESAGEIEAWQQLVTAGRPVTIPPNSQYTILWDFQTYLCGYPGLAWSDGAGSVVEWGWAESLYEAKHPRDVVYQTLKGNRNEIREKVFVGLNDRWLIGDESVDAIPTLWWRSGRYVRLRIRTAGRPLTLSRAEIVTTGYPLELAAEWSSSDAEWDRLMSFFVRTYICAAHETWADSPYYEQMCYMGDALIDSLSSYALFSDTRICRHALRLFDWSRRASGLIPLRYPSGWRQESINQTLLWPTMVRDYAWWCDDPVFVRSLLPALRSTLAEVEGMAEPDGLLRVAPGWPVVDWVPEWSEEAGCPPGMRDGDSSILNFEWVLGLVAAAQVEEAYGDPVLADRASRLSRKVFSATLDRYWDEERGLVLDTHGRPSASEHAQAFALLTGLLEEDKANACLAALRNGEGLSKAAIYFSFYVLDALYLYGMDSDFHRRLEFWRGLPIQGFMCTPEGPEPTRSDSHSYAAHPGWHTMASIAGVRPDAKGFSRVRIAPLPGSLAHFHAKVVHPLGFIEVEFRRESGGVQFNVSLPESTPGTLVFDGQSYNLVPGLNPVFVRKA